MRRAFAAGFALGLAAGGASAQAPTRGDAGPLASALDELVAVEMERRHFGGVVVAVADRDGVRILRGWGFRDPATRTPVDPETTAFRVASVSKLFTATAVMQLVEQGRIDLDRDVNHYLRRFQVPATFPEPITTRQLLTHTAGIGERFSGGWTLRREDLVPLGDYLASSMAPRFIRPGQVMSYANHGVSLAGHLVEAVSGREFAEYVREEVLRPLSMTQSGVGMEPPLLANLALGQVFASGALHAVPLDFRHPVPSGSLVTTASDAARFVRAFLRGGELDERRILQPASVDAMLRRQFSPHPALRGVGLAWMELRVDGRDLFGHDGDLAGYNARIALDREAGLGLFVAYTGTDSFKTFADQVTAVVFASQAPPPPRPPLVSTGEPVDPRVAGTYRWTRAPRSGVERLFVPFQFAQYRCAIEPGGEIGLSHPLGILAASRWRPAGALLFQEVGGERRLAFREEDGRVTHLLLEGPIPMAFERIAWWETVPVQFGLLAAFPLAFAASGLANAAAARRARGSRRWMHAVAAGTSALNLACVALAPRLVGLQMFAGSVPPPAWLAPPGNPPYFYGLAPGTRVVLALPLVALAISALLLARFPRAPRRVWTAAALAIAFVAVLALWNVLPGA